MASRHRVPSVTQPSCQKFGLPDFSQAVDSKGFVSSAEISAALAWPRFRNSRRAQAEISAGGVRSCVRPRACGPRSRHIATRDFLRTIAS
ncbi:conserved hypothetical protein [Burkholderia vietnamiensis]